MALERSTDIHKTSYDNSQHEESGIEISHIEGNIYDSLETRNRDSHAYSTTGEIVATAKTDTHNVADKAQPNDTGKRVAYSSLKVELPICQAAIAIFLVCMLICTLSGLIVHSVINAKIAEIEGHTSRNYKAIQDTLASLQETQNSSEMASITIDRRLATLDNVVGTVQETIETVQETVGTVQETIETVQETIETVKENHNTSEMSSISYHTNIDRRLATLDNMMQAVQKKQNISGQQIAFTASGASGKTVNTVLRFRNVILNVGEGYNQTTGQFSCPVAGTYLFSATLLSVYTRSSGTYCYIRNNANRVALVYSYEGTHDSASASVLLHLSVGDLVDFGSCTNEHYIATNNGRTSFIGCLIQAD